MSRPLGAAGEALIKSFETLRLAAYQDQGGIWTCGWGHTGPDVTAGTTCTPEQAQTWFQADTGHAASVCSAVVPLSATQNQFDAVVSFAYNVGVGAFLHSTLRDRLNALDFAGAAAQFPLWDHVNGTVSDGLYRRRMAEQTLFLS